MNPVKWVATHEPVLAGAVTAAVGVAAILDTSTDAKGGLIGAISASLALLGGFVSRFTTSPATKAKIQTGIDSLPQLEKDAAEAITTVKQLRAEFDSPTNDGKGLLATAKSCISDHIANHLDSFDKSVDEALDTIAKVTDDAVSHVKAVVEPEPVPAEPVATPVTEPAPEAAPVAVEPVAVEPEPAAAEPVDPFEVLAQIAAS